MQSKVNYNQLVLFTERIFTQNGCHPEAAKTAAEVLVSADLQGVDSHGVARLPNYIRLSQMGRINLQPKMKIVHETPSTAAVDGDKGLGLIVAPFAMQVAINKAKTAGTGWVSVKNSSHFGIAGHHAKKALKEQMIGIAMTNATALVAPTYSIERMLGTNPIAVAIPAKTQPAFVADFATTAASNGKLEIMARNNTPAPDGLVQDAAGATTNDPEILKKGGIMLPLGTDKVHGSHKGYALGSIVDIFSAVLSGASYGPWAPPFPPYVPMPVNMPGEGLGHFFGAMRVDAFRPAEEFLAHMDNWITRFRAATPAPGHEKVLIPGDPERECAAERMEHGIPLNEQVYNDLKKLGTEQGVPFPA